ncbi:MAG: hypothetical protein FWB74_00310 [Defluviitaleaceae bacterium]|nr:hypothetical protein [Defluviitaleaceae bacterium]
MPKWTQTKVAGSAKIWVDMEGNTQVAYAGELTATELSRICRFIKNNKNDLFEAWQELFSDLEFFGRPDERFILDSAGKLKSN